MKYEVTPAVLRGVPQGTVSIAKTEETSISLSPPGKADQPLISKKANKNKTQLSWMISTGLNNNSNNKIF